MNQEFWNIYKEIDASFKKEKENKYEYKNDYKIEKEKEKEKEQTNINETKLSEKNQIKDKEICVYCLEENCLISDIDMITCTLCGTENDHIIDRNAEWRFYGNDDNKRSSDPNRCGMPTNQIISDSTLSTVILGRGFEIYRKLNSWNGLTYKEKSLIAILNKIAQKANIDNVPQSIIDSTMKMYKIVSKDYIKRGTSRECLIAACFFNALKDNNMIRSNEEVAKLFGVKSKKLSKGCNEFAELMYQKDKDYVKKMRPIDSKDLIERFCVVLEIDERYIDIANTVALLVDKLGICQENNPKSIAVGCIYLISQNYNLGFTKKEIADNCHTSEVTVSNTYSQMAKFKKYLFPKSV